MEYLKKPLFWVKYICLLIFPIIVLNLRVYFFVDPSGLDTHEKKHKKQKRHEDDKERKKRKKEKKRKKQRHSPEHPVGGGISMPQQTQLF